MRVVRFLHRNVRVLVWSMREWYGYIVRVNMECASTVMCKWCGHNAQVNMECESTVMCK